MDFIIAFYRLLSSTLFLFLYTTQDNNNDRVLSSHNFLIVFGKRCIVRYWSTSVCWVQMRCAIIFENVPGFLSFNDNSICRIRQQM